MANQQRGELGVTVGGKPYILRPTFDALCNLEEAAGKPIDRIMEDIKEGRMSGIRGVIFCLLQDQHGDQISTLKHASEWIESAGGPDQALDMIYRVLGINAEDGKSANPPHAQVDEGTPGTGETPTSVPAGSV